MTAPGSTRLPALSVLTARGRARCELPLEDDRDLGMLEHGIMLGIQVAVEACNKVLDAHIRQQDQEGGDAECPAS